MNGRYIACLALAVVIPLSEAHAQESIEAGTRVRVTAPDIARKPISGTVSSVDVASITLTASGQTVGSAQKIPLASVRRLEIYRGRSHSPLKGMETGLLVGAGIGFAIGVGAALEDGSAFVCEGAGCVLAGTLGGALWGTIVGGLFGAAIGHDEWDEVMVVRPLVSVLGNARGFKLALSLRL